MCLMALIKSAKNTSLYLLYSRLSVDSAVQQPGEQDTIARHSPLLGIDLRRAYFQSVFDLVIGIVKIAFLL